MATKTRPALRVVTANLNGVRAALRRGGLAWLAQMHVGVDQARHGEQALRVDPPRGCRPSQRSQRGALGGIVAGVVAFQLRDAAVREEHRPPMEPTVVAQPAGVVDLELHSHSMVPGGLVVRS